MKDRLSAFAAQKVVVVTSFVESRVQKLRRPVNLSKACQTCSFWASSIIVGSINLVLLLYVSFSSKLHRKGLDDQELDQ